MVWSSIKSSLQKSLSESEFGLWVKPLECSRQDEQCLELVGPDRFFCKWVEDRYLPMISKAASELGAEMEVKLSVADHPFLPTSSTEKGQMKLPGLNQGTSTFRSLHPAYTFDQFMVGESNLLAKSACNAMALGDRTFGNCLFMNSGTGLGKSHLTQAVVHQIFDTAPSTRLHYMTAQQFSAEMVQNIRGNSMEKFSRKYINNCDMLLVEDIHTLAGKNKTQEELNTILDYLIKSGRRVILTSALAPSKLKGLDEDFRSRMTSGLVTGIESPDYDTRARILSHKLMVNNLHTDDDVVDYLARNLKGDIRRIESTVMGIKAKSCLRGQNPDLSLVKEVIGDLLGNVEDVSATAIRDLICNQFNVSADALRSRSRKRSVTYPRQIAMYLTRKYTNESLADIGNVYNRDHSTVLYAIKVITRDMTQKNATKEQVKMLCSKIDS